MRRLLVLLAVALLVGLALLWRPREPGPAPRAAVTTPPRDAPAVRYAAAKVKVPLPPLAAGVAPAEALPGRSGPAALAARARLRATLAYPPWSRPLGPESALLRPNRRHETVAATHADPSVTYLLTADRYYVVGDAPVPATLRVWRDGRPVKPRVTRAFLGPVAPGAAIPGEGARAPVRFSAAGDVVLRPGSVAGERASIVGLFVEFDYGGEEVQRARLRFHVTPGTGVPARFTGGFRDAVEDGSLVVRVEVDVAAAGHYRVDANLYDANGAPVAWARARADLAPGRAEVPLVFFGKAILERGGVAPFRIGELRGARYVPDADPDLEQMPPPPAAYVTETRDTSGLSDAAWDGPRKRALLGDPE
jgi:hypothetical protein